MNFQQYGISRLSLDTHRTSPKNLLRTVSFRSLDRNAAAILRYFDEHHAPLFRFAWRLTGSVADAEDIVQECFLALLRPDCAFDSSRGSLRTYLFGAVRKQALKRQQPRHNEPDAQGATTPECEYYVTELKEASRVRFADCPKDNERFWSWLTTNACLWRILRRSLK